MATELCTVYETEKVTGDCIHFATIMCTDIFIPLRKIIIRIHDKGNESKTFYKPLGVYIFDSDEPETTPKDIWGIHEYIGKIENIREEEVSCEFINKCIKMQKLKKEMDNINESLFDCKPKFI